MPLPDASLLAWLTDTLIINVICYTVFFAISQKGETSFTLWPLLAWYDEAEVHPGQYFVMRLLSCFRTLYSLPVD